MDNALSKGFESEGVFKGESEEEVINSDLVRRFYQDMLIFIDDWTETEDNNRVYDITVRIFEITEEEYTEEFEMMYSDRDVPYWV